MLLAIWADVGDQMRQLLRSITLADIAAIARGKQPWPAPAASIPD